MNGFTVLFVSLLALTLGVQLWLAQRQARHVSRHRAAVPPGFAAQVPQEAHAKAADYTVAKTRLAMAETTVGALLLLALTLGGGLEWLDRAWRSLQWGPVATGAGFLLSVFLLLAVLDLPFDLYRTFKLEQRFGFNKMTPQLFAVDLIKKLLLFFAIGAPLAAAVLWLMQGMGTAWWLYVWVLWSAFGLIMLWAYPALIAPLFNKFRPLDKEDLKRRIEVLLERVGFQSRGVFVMDGSTRSAHGNAYFTGLGRNKRIVLFDTLIDRLTPGEVEAVFAHELGHFKFKHVRNRMLLSFVFSLLGLALLGWLSRQAWFYSGLGVSQPSMHAALVLFLLVAPVFTFFLQPLFSWSSRRHEFQADVFAARQSDAGAMIEALVKLYKDNASTLTPDPLHSAFYDSHPPPAARIEALQPWLNKSCGGSSWQTKSSASRPV